jgi:hypothetical protein
MKDLSVLTVEQRGMKAPPPRRGIEMMTTATAVLDAAYKAYCDASVNPHDALVEYCDDLSHEDVSRLVSSVYHELADVTDSKRLEFLVAVTDALSLTVHSIIEWRTGAADTLTK